MTVPGNSPPNSEVVDPGADHRDGQHDRVGDPQAGAGQRVVGQRVAGEALEEAEQEQRDADDPVELARLAERAGEEDPEHVHDDRGHEQQRRPVVHLPHDQAAAHVEGQVQRRRVRLATSRSRAAGRSCRCSVTSLHRRVEEQRQEGAGQQQDDERVERDLAEQERPVVREDLVEQPAQRCGRLEAGRRAASPAAAGRDLQVNSCVVFMAAPRSRGRPAPGSRDVATKKPSSSTVERQHRQPPGGRAEDRPGVVEDVELRLVARAEQPVGLLLVQAGRAAGVGADLRVRHVVAPHARRSAASAARARGWRAALAASSSRRWISSVGESAYWLVAPPGMPGKTVIWPPTLTSSGRIGGPSSRASWTGLPPLFAGFQPVVSRMSGVVRVLDQAADQWRRRDQRRPAARPSGTASLSSGRRLMPSSSAMLSRVAPVSSRSSAVDGAVVPVLDRDLLGQQLLGPGDDRRSRAASSDRPRVSPSSGV